MLRGGYYRIFNPKTGRELFVPNTVVAEGQQAFAKMLMQGDATIVSAGGNFYLGVCGVTVTEVDTLADVSGEPTGAGGYARQAITRDAVGFPTIDQVNGVYRAKSKNITFTASGAAYSTAFRRLFLCDAASGSVGTLFSYSGPFPAIQLEDTDSQIVNWELYFNW